MSVVYEAENVRLGNTIALKVLAPELSTDDAFRARFLKESRLAASLNHPNVIPIYDSGPCEDLLYIAMRYVAGSDLRTVLNAQERISPGQALLLIGQAGRALDAAHRLGLVHRDVKPANILIERGADDEPDHVYMADFGLTKHTLSRSGLTATGQFVGTIDYIAPEQIQDKSVDGRADIYSLGCVLYECLTGQVPFAKDLDAAVIWAHVEELPTPPSAIRPELGHGIDEVIMRALAKDPNDRYPTCREFLGAASAVLEPGTQTSGSPASGVDVAAGPPTVLSGRPTEAPTSLPPLAAATSSGTPSGNGGSHGGPPTASGAGPEQPPGLTGPGPETVLASGADSLATAGQEPPPASEKPDRPEAGARGPGRKWLAVLLLALIAAAIAAVVLTSSSTTPAGKLSSSTLLAVPTNHVTGSGKATVRLNGDVAVVTVTTNGLDNGAALVHAMHIHAGGKGQCPPPSAARLHNGHLAISTTDGINYYGPPAQALTTSGDTSVASILAFPRYLSGGTLRYSRTIALPPPVAEQIRGNNAVIVVHGIDYDGSGIYSGVLERSELNKSVPGTATAPALCGHLVGPVGVAALNPRGRGHALLYSASLVVSAAAQSLPPNDLFLCHAGYPTTAARETRRPATQGNATA